MKEMAREDIKSAYSFKGNLRDFRIPDILIGINRSAKTGVLEITHGAIVKKVFFDKGDMIFSSSNNKDDRLVEYLLKNGKIGFTEYENASHVMSNAGEKTGKVLVELGCLTPQELAHEVRKLTEEIIISLFPLEEGEFEFKEGPFDSDETITLQISAANIIYHGMKNMNSLGLIEQMCPSMDDILNLSQNPVQIFQSLNIAQTDKKILTYINGIYPLKTILSLSPSSDFETLKTISAFVCIGLIHVKEEYERPPKISIEDIFEEPEEEPEYFLKAMKEVFNKCERLGYYEALGVGKNASHEDIKKAYFSVSKQFHPDRHFSFISHDIKEKLLKIISYTTEAYEILSDPEKRREYNKTLEENVSERATEDGQTTISHGDSLAIEIVEVSEKTDAKDPERIDLPEKIRSAAPTEEFTKTERGEAKGEFNPVYESGSDGLEDIFDETALDVTTMSDEEELATDKPEVPEEVDMNEPEHLDLSDEILSAADAKEFVEAEGSSLEEDEDLEGTGRELHQSDNFSEEIGSLVGVDELTIEETEEIKKIESIRVHDRAVEERKEVDVKDPFPAIANHGIVKEKARFRKSLIYFPVVLITIIILGIAVPLVDDNTNMQLFQTAPTVTTVTKKTYLPPFRDDAFTEASLDRAGHEEGLTKFPDKELR